MKKEDKKFLLFIFIPLLFFTITSANESPRFKQYPIKLPPRSKPLILGTENGVPFVKVAGNDDELFFLTNTGEIQKKINPDAIVSISQNGKYICQIGRAHV